MTSVPAMQNFGQRKSAGDLFTSTTKSFHNLRKAVMPRIQQVLLDVMDEKHHGEWLSVLDYLMQLTKQQNSHNVQNQVCSSQRSSSARKNLQLDEFTDLLIVKRSAEWYVHASTTEVERKKLLHLFIGSLSLQETNSLLERTVHRLFHPKLADRTDQLSPPSKIMDHTVKRLPEHQVCTMDQLQTTPPAVFSSMAVSTFSSERPFHSIKRPLHISISKSNWNKMKQFSLDDLLAVKSTPLDILRKGTREISNEAGVEIVDFPIRSISVSSSSTSSCAHSQSSEQCTTNINLQGRLGFSPEEFSKSSIVRQISKSYRSAPFKEVKEILLSLCVGSFTREEINRLVIQPSAPVRKRNFDQVSKAWWRHIRCLAEQDASSIPMYVASLLPIRPPKRSRGNSDGTGLSHSQHTSDDSIRPDLQLARRQFLQGGLSLLSNAYMHQLPSEHPATARSSTGFADDDMIDSDAIDGMLTMKYPQINTPGVEGNTHNPIIFNVGKEGNIIDDIDEDDGGEGDDCDSLGEYIHEDEANFYFEL